MIKKSFIATLTATFILSSCSTNDDNQRLIIDNKEGVLSNAEITLTYGADLLSQYVNLDNKTIPFNNYTANTKARTLSYSNSTTKVYSKPNLTNAIVLSGSNDVNINESGKTYYIPEGQVFSGNINFNQSATIYVLGTWNNGRANVPNYSKIEVSPSGIINNPSLILNNSTSIIDNYGTVNYGQNSINGIINNYNQLVFNKNINLNSGSVVNNNCSLIFNESVILNTNIINNSYAKFNKDIRVNGSGNLIINPGSLTDIISGNIDIDGKVINEGNQFARIDIENAKFGILNANPAFIGNIDINTKLSIPNEKIDSRVVLNANSYVGNNNCIPQRGVPECNDNNLNYTLVAQVKSPTVNNTILSATDVKIDNGKAYISYHTNDEFYGDAPNGSIRIFDIQNQQSPSLIAQADFNNIEFNGIDINNSKLYAVGGNKSGARLITAVLNSGIFNTTNLSLFESHKLPSTGAKNSYFYNNQLWLVSGATNGGFFSLNNDYSINNQYYNEGSRAKYVAQNGKLQAFFAVENTGAYLRIANIDGSNNKEFRFSNLTQKVQNGKNVITMDDDFVYIALSDLGVAKISLTDGELVNHFIPNSFRINNKKIFTNNGYTNGVAIDNCYLYLANGADGVIVLNKNTFNVIGSFKLSESSNYIYSKNGLLFVATGRDGLNIIKVN